MKRIFLLLLCAGMLLTLCACTQSGAGSKKAALQVGFGRADITPQESVQLRGYSGAENRWSKHVLDPLYATCVAFSDETGETVLLYHMDLCIPSGAGIPYARKVISEAVGISMDNVMVSCTHTHSAPDIGSESLAMERYCAYMEAQMLAAARDALADRKTAEMYTASTTLKNMNFVRHYRMDDGSVVGDNFEKTAGRYIVDHVRDADNEMQLIRFERAGGKDVVLVNWQVHPHRTGGMYATDVSADIVGAMRMYMEPRLDCHMAYFTGASGNLNPTSRLPSERVEGDYLDQGATMAREAMLALEGMTLRETGAVQILRRDVMCSKSRAGSVEFVNYAFSIGDVGFVVAPYEMFDTNGMFIKENSPFAMTFVVTCANATNYYVAAEWAYYENTVAYEVTNGDYAKGTAEMLADSYVEMLNELHAAK